MVGHGGNSAGSYLADPTSPIPSHCASVVATSTLRVNGQTAIMGVLHGISGTYSGDLAEKHYMLTVKVCGSQLILNLT